MENFWVVGQQVLVLFVLIFVGLIFAKQVKIDEKGAKLLSDIALLLATTCVIVNSFVEMETGGEKTSLLTILLALAVSLGLNGVGIAVAHLFYRGKSSRERVLRMAVVMSNAGFMGLPLQQALLGGRGVIYGATYVVAFNLVLWSYGVITMDGDRNRLSVGKMLLNPGMIGLLAGMAVVVFHLPIPAIIGKPIAFFAALNTPLPMLVIGYYLSKVNFAQSLRRPEYYGAMLLRLLVVPSVGIVLCCLCGIRGDLLMSMAISVSAPTAAAVPMFAGRYDRDPETAVNLVALSTVASALTMPLIVSLVRMFAYAA